MRSPETPSQNPAAVTSSFLVNYIYEEQHFTSNVDRNKLKVTALQYDIETRTLYILIDEKVDQSDQGDFKIERRDFRPSSHLFSAKLSTAELAWLFARIEADGGYSENEMQAHLIRERQLLREYHLS